MTKKSVKDLCTIAAVFAGGCIIGRLDCMHNILKHDKDMESIAYKGKFGTFKLCRITDKIKKTEEEA